MSVVIGSRRTGARVMATGACLWLGLVLCVYYVRLPDGLTTQTWQVMSSLGDPTLPHLAGAVAHAVRAVAGAAVLLVSATILGLGISRWARWRYESWREALPVVTTLGIGTFAFGGLGLALAGLYRPPVLQLLVAIPLITGIVLAVANRRRLGGAGAPRSWRPPHRQEWLWIGCGILTAGVTLIAALAPEIECDAVWFHLYFPRLFLEHGRLVDLPTEYVSLYPMTFELWLGYGLALGGPAVAKLLHFLCLPVIGVLVYELTRRCAPRAPAWLAVALFTTVPLIQWEASTAYVDLATALYVTLMVYSLLRYVEARHSQWLVLAALSLGLALATKHLALVVVPLACGGLVLRLWLEHRRLETALRPAIAFAVIALVLPLPWYVRSWLASGNPVFPELFHLFGALPERWDNASEGGLEAYFARFGRPRTPWTVLTLPWDLTMHAARYGGALGPFFLGLVPLVACGRQRRALWWVAAFVAGYGALWASPLASFQIRWLIPIVPALAVLAAAGFSRVTGLARLAGGPRVALALAAGCAFLLLLNLPFFTTVHERDRSGWRGWLTHTLHGVPLGVVAGAETRERYLERNLPTYQAWRFINATLPLDARVLTWSGGDHFYSERDRIPALSAPAGEIAWARAPEGPNALAGLRRLGITHVLIDRRFLERDVGLTDRKTWEEYALIGSRAREAWSDTVYDDGRTIVYRLRGTAVEASSTR